MTTAALSGVSVDQCPGYIPHPFIGCESLAHAARPDNRPGRGQLPCGE